MNSRTDTSRSTERPLLRLDVAGAEVPEDLGEVTKTEYQLAISWAIRHAPEETEWVIGHWLGTARVVSRAEFEERAAALAMAPVREGQGGPKPGAGGM